MPKRSRRTHAPELKAKVTVAAVRNEGTLAELAKRFAVHPAKVTAWKEQLLQGAREGFREGRRSDPPIDVRTLHARIGELTQESDLLAHALGTAGLLSARR